MSFKPWALIKMCMSTNKKGLINQLGPFEKPKFLIVLGVTWPRPKWLMSRLESYE